MHHHTFWGPKGDKIHVNGEILRKKNNSFKPKRVKTMFIEYVRTKYLSLLKHCMRGKIIWIKISYSQLYSEHESQITNVEKRIMTSKRNQILIKKVVIKFVIHFQLMQYIERKAQWHQCYKSTYSILSIMYHQTPNYKDYQCLQKSPNSSQED